MFPKILLRPSLVQALELPSPNEEVWGSIPGKVTSFAADVLANRDNIWTDRCGVGCLSLLGIGLNPTGQDNIKATNLTFLIKYFTTERNISA